MVIFVFCNIENTVETENMLVGYSFFFDQRFMLIFAILYCHTHFEALL